MKQYRSSQYHFWSFRGLSNFKVTRGLLWRDHFVEQNRTVYPNWQRQMLKATARLFYAHLLRLGAKNPKDVNRKQEAQLLLR